MTMDIERCEALKREWVGKSVDVEASRPELARWANVRGRIVAINGAGRALVQFEGTDLGWYDIELDYLSIADPIPSVDT
jgi:hypothetical protein